jgi:hypothetical protein
MPEHVTNSNECTPEMFGGRIIMYQHLSLVMRLLSMPETESKTGKNNMRTIIKQVVLMVSKENNS